MNRLDEVSGARPRLVAIAYGILGEVADAEDVVQDAFVRWAADDRSAVRNVDAFLTTMVTRLSIDELRSARRRRIDYVGPWLPEPIVRVPGAADPGDVVAEAEQVSLALLTAFERLGPIERAVLVLRDVMDLDYHEIADAIDRSPEATRQIASRARGRIGDADRRRSDAVPDAEVIAELLGAVADGDVARLGAVLAPDVVVWADGGGVRRAAVRPVVGLDRVIRFVLGIRKFAEPGDLAAIGTANGEPALVIERDGQPYSVTAFDVAEGRIVGMRSMMQPDKLGHVPPVGAAGFDLSVTT